MGIPLPGILCHTVGMPTKVLVGSLSGIQLHRVPCALPFYYTILYYTVQAVSWPLRVVRGRRWRRGPAVRCELWLRGGLTSMAGRLSPLRLSCFVTPHLPQPPISSRAAQLGGGGTPASWRVMWEEGAAFHWCCVLQPGGVCVFSCLPAGSKLLDGGLSWIS